MTTPWRLYVSVDEEQSSARKNANEAGDTYLVVGFNTVDGRLQPVELTYVFSKETALGFVEEDTNYLDAVAAFVVRHDLLEIRQASLRLLTSAGQIPAEWEQGNMALIEDFLAR